MKQTLVVLSLFAFAACDYSNPEDYCVKAEYKAFVKLQKEMKQSKGGKVDSSKPDAGNLLTVGKSKYDMYCVACHGADGKANGAAAAAMKPRPRNFTDKKWQASVDDARLVKVLKEGGASVGLSSSMAAWSGVLTDDEINAVVAYVRDFGK